MSACKELHSVSHTENISLSYDPFIETKHCLKMHVVPGNFIVASHESCHRSSSSKRIEIEILFQNCRRVSTPSRTEVAKLKLSARR